MNNRNLHIVILLAMATLLFGTNMGGYDLWPADEPRFGQVAREMMDSHDYLAPHVNGQPYREKPPLLFWAIALVSQPFGQVTETSARIPSLVAALFTLLCTYLLAERLFDRRTALWSAIILATSFRFWWQARTVQIDMLLTACLTLALLLFWTWYKQRRTRFLIAFYLAIAAAVYAKGPPGIVFPLLMIITFFWKNKEQRRKTHWILGTLAVALLIAAWLIPARMSVAAEGINPAQSAIATNLFRQTIGRFLLGVNHAQPPWYYFQTLAVDLMPWTLFLPFAIPFLWKRRKQGPEMRLLLSWTIPALIFFTISFGKRAIYLLPIFPAIAILLAHSVLHLMNGERITWRKRTAAAWAVFAAILAMTPIALPFTQYQASWSTKILVFIIAAACLAAHALYTALKTDAHNLHRTMAFQAATLQLLTALIILPAVNPYTSAREICTPLRTLSDTGVDYHLYSIGFTREEYIFYAHHFHQPLLTEPIQIDLPPGYQDTDPIELQTRLWKTIADAIEKVPFEVPEHPGPNELQAPADIIQRTLQEHNIPPPLSQAFTTALTRELEVLSPPKRPIFALIRARDHRWLHPLTPHLTPYKTIRRATVGSRDILLLANETAQRLTSETDPR